ncbi:DUF1302 domain-containing protein [Halomonas halocynthiae]|uniref:DUF1302 domain-containing protein n=1 Tax=Halomonas halocynthiae TaxID=176290 RepID=UPI0004001344|nr:DUF1302 family protein [Halomonas halocynthiae]
MKQKSNNLWKKTVKNPVFACLTSSFFSLGVVAPVTAGELVFGDLESGLGEGIEWQKGNTRLNVKGALSIGTIRRANNPSKRLTSPQNSMNIVNDGNLNYRRGDAVSTSADAYLQADLSQNNVGLLISAKGWYDYTQKHEGVHHGSVNNNYHSGAPLSDDGFVPLGRFSNAVINDAYVYGDFKPAGHDLHVRLGNLSIPWKTPTTIPGGLHTVNAFDIASMRRSSSIAEARTIAMPSVYAELSLTDNLKVDAFTQFDFNPDVLPGCGTFLSTSDYAQPGCDKITLNGSVLSALKSQRIRTTDGQSIANPLDYVTRGKDHHPNDNQFGIGLHYLWEDVGLFGFYYTNYTSRNPLTHVTRIGPGILTPAAANVGQATPTGIAAIYTRAFPTDIDMYAVNFKTRLPAGTGIYAEYSLRPNQPVAWNGSDFITGLLSGSGPLGYLANTPTGYVAPGYDRFSVSQLNLGASHPLGNILGGEAKVSAEVGMKYVHDLPSTDERRYGRPGFGTAAHDSYAPCTGSAAKCAVKGFVTPFSWGTRFKLASEYTSIVPGLNLTPSLSLGYDIKGYSYDNVFSEGRYGAIFGIEGVFNKNYIFDVSYLKIGGGDYNLIADRSMYQASIGVRF